MHQLGGHLDEFADRYRAREPNIADDAVTQ